MNTDGQIITKLLGHRQTKSLKAIQKITYIQDGSLLVSSDYKRLRFWNPKNGFLLAELELDFGYNGFSISPDGRLLTFLGDDGIIRVFGVKKYE